MLAIFEQEIDLYFLLFQILKRFIIFKLFIFIISYSFIMTLPQIRAWRALTFSIVYIRFETNFCAYVWSVWRMKFIIT
jgi:hypothetical protein